jgi:hypothetical protein
MANSDFVATGVHSNKYDLAGRLISTSVSAAPDRAASDIRTFGYTPLGRIASAVARLQGQAPRKLSLTYDSLGRRIFEASGPTGAGVRHSYGTGFDHLTVSASGQQYAADRGSDALGRPTTISFSGAPFSGWLYADGEVKSLNYANAVTLQYGYDDVLNVVSQTLVGATGELTSLLRGYGSDGVPHRATLKVAGAPTETRWFETDESGRVVAERTDSSGAGDMSPLIENDQAHLAIGIGRVPLRLRWSRQHSSDLG